MVQTRSSFKKNTTDTNVEVNRDVTEASNRNTMIQKKRKTIAENSILKPIEASKKTTKKVVNARDAGTSKDSKSKSVVDPCKDKVILRKTTKTSIALDVYLCEYQKEYIKNHPGETKLPEEENFKAQKKFRELVKTTKYYIVKKYLKKFKDEEAARIARNPRCVRYFLGFKL
ncbi:uncharacterized protein LOC130826173 [Amaranthus tricolor]|uniref:uncharacterized protein LOC130826173 n=1 Tax=Amaranthus tricolor TaxID=29722 RepID=UPI00258DF512|nr:uncharacterized protein LOC130826173 [Amaranthus tricolor]